VQDYTIDSSVSLQLRPRARFWQPLSSGSPSLGGVLFSLLSLATVAPGLGCSSVADHTSSGSVTPNTAKAKVIPLSFSDVGVQSDGGVARFKGLAAGGKPGQPALPSKTVRVLLDPDADLRQVEVTIEGAEESVLPGVYKVEPQALLVPDQGGRRPTSSNIVDGKDMDVYSKSELFPASNVSAPSTGQLHRFKILQVTVSPYRWNPSTGELRVLTGGRLVVRAASDSAASDTKGDGTAATEQRYRQRLAKLVVNFDEEIARYQPVAAVPQSGLGVNQSALLNGTNGYVIITTDQIRNSSQYINQFVDSKVAHGFSVSLITETATSVRKSGMWATTSSNRGGGWGGGVGDVAANRIRSWLRNNYASSNLAYVLLVGNPDTAAGDVPMKAVWPGLADDASGPVFAPTDYYYAELTGNWDNNGNGKFGELADYGNGGFDQFLEVSVGRIPYYGVVADLDHILAKSIVYGEAPANAIAWRKNALLGARRLDETTRTYLLNEWIRSAYLIPNGWASTRVYDEDFGVQPDITPCNYDTFPPAWRATPRGLVVWSGHGSYGGTEQTMRTDLAPTLDDLHPSMTIQSSCMNAYPEQPNNLAYALLRNGAITTIAATRDGTYSPEVLVASPWEHGDGFASSCAKYLVQENKSVGDAVSLAREELDPAQSWVDPIVYNVYGDPSLAISTSGTGPIPMPTVPGKPTADGRESSVVLTWNPVASASAYRILRSITESGPYAQVATTSATSYEDTGVTPGTTYYYVVSALNSFAESAVSADVSARPTAPATVQYQLGDSNATDNVIQPLFQVVNTGSSPLPLAGVTLRYWFTNDNGGNVASACQAASLSSGTVTTRIVNLPSPLQRADSYLEVGFTSGAPSLATGQSSGAIQCQLSHTSSLGFVETNDYSYDATRTTYANFRFITGYLNGDRIWGDEPPTVAQPYGPAFLSANAGNGSVALIWSSESSVISYHVYREAYGANPQLIANTTETQFIDVAVTNGIPYTYYVKAVDQSGQEGSPSAFVQAHPSADAPTAPVTAPTGLNLRPQDPNTLITWGAVANATAYNLKRATSSNGPFAILGSPNETQLLANGFNNDGTYYVTVSAINAAGEGPNAPVVAYQAGNVLAIQPGKITDVTATPGDAQVSLTWSSVTGATYLVKRSTSGAALQLVATTSAASYADSGLTNGVTYSYVIVATNMAGESPASDNVSVTPVAQLPCSPAQDMTGNSSGNFNTTGSVCKRTSNNINGWGCSNFAGRTVKVNGVAMTCGNTPLPAKVNGYYYFDVSAGSYSWASLYWW